MKDSPAFLSLPSGDGCIESRKKSPPAEPLDCLERQVVMLAVSSSKECTGVARRGTGPGWLRRLLDFLLPDEGVRPLANPRLEALRQLACAMFKARGDVDERMVEQALNAGVRAEQVQYLARAMKRAI